jgi:succinoglycan biosynthesis protein ExoV
MKLTYYEGDLVGINFGDQLNCWLWPRMLPGFLDEDDSKLFLGIGTIISKWLPKEQRKIIFGSGTTPEIAPTLDPTWDVIAVRGPLTANVLGISQNLAVTDPAILVAEFVKNSASDGAVTLMIHHARSKRANWKLACSLAGINYVDPHDNVDYIMAALSRSRLVLAEAMHAAIVADALRVPWIPVTVHDHINTFKWLDWCQSMRLDYRPVVLAPLLDGSSSWRSKLRAKILPYYLASKLSQIARIHTPLLSHDSVLASRKEELLSRIDLLRRAL